MNFPCPNVIPEACPSGASADDPLGNFTAELPDKNLFFKRWYPVPKYQPPVVPTFCQGETQSEATICAQNKVWLDGGVAGVGNSAQSCNFDCPDGSSITFTVQPGTFFAIDQAGADATAASFACESAALICEQEVFASTQQTCQVTCEDLSVQSYTAPAGSASGDSQESADAAAHAFACLAAQAQCVGIPETFTSEATFCTYSCPDGHLVKVNVPAGLFTGLSQSEANASAVAFACAKAAALCLAIPSVVFNTAQTCTAACGASSTIPAGQVPSDTQQHANDTALALACLAAAQQCNGPTPNVPVPIVVFNTPQVCVVNCPNGGTYTFPMNGGTYAASSVAIANAIAVSKACELANLEPVCIGNITTFACLGRPYLSTITPVSTAISYSIVGSLPPGLSLVGNNLSGTPTTAGTYTFTVHGNVISGAVCDRAFSLIVGGVTTSSLPGGVVTDPVSPYSAVLGSSGITSPVWSIDSGSLPPGLSLSSSGVISGGPTFAGSYNFVAKVVGLNATCTKALSIGITGTVGSCPDWNAIAWEAPTVTSPSGTLWSFAHATNTFDVSGSNTNPSIRNLQFSVFGNLNAGTSLAPCNANLRLVCTFSSTDPFTIGFSVDIANQSFTLFYLFTGDLHGDDSGTLDFPFTVPAGENVNVHVSFGINNFSDANPANLSVHGVLTTEP